MHDFLFPWESTWFFRVHRQFGWVGLPGIRARRRVPYANELLARAKGVNYGRIRTKKRAR